MQNYREFAFTADHFNRLRSLVGLHTGISITDAKRELVYSRLSRRLRQLGMDSFETYCGMLEAGDAAEIPQFVNAITTNLTAFFREAHHFQILADKVLPEMSIAVSGKLCASSTIRIIFCRSVSMPFRKAFRIWGSKTYR